MIPSTVHELTLQLKYRGLMEKTPLRIIGELALHVANTTGGLVLFVVADSWLLAGPALLVSTLGLLGVSTNTHTSAHGATSDSARVNWALTCFGYPFMLMLSATYWRHKHNVIHHPVPNVVDADADVDLSPYFALTADQYEAAVGWRRRWYSAQWIFFPFALAANGFNVQFASWRYLLSQLLRPETRATKHWWDLSMMLLHVMTWLIVPSFFFSPGDVVCLYILRIVLMGYAMFAAFAPAHFPAAAQAAAFDQKDEDFVLIQTVNTINFETGPVGRFLCSGVDYQIEHHLFPFISHPHYPAVAAVLREYCEVKGYPYRALPWGRAIWESLVIMKNPKKVIKNLRAHANEMAQST